MMHLTPKVKLVRGVYALVRYGREFDRNMSKAHTKLQKELVLHLMLCNAGVEIVYVFD